MKHDSLSPDSTGVVLIMYKTAGCGANILIAHDDQRGANVPGSRENSRFGGSNSVSCHRPGYRLARTRSGGRGQAQVIEICGVPPNARGELLQCCCLLVLNVDAWSKQCVLIDNAPEPFPVFT